MKSDQPPTENRRKTVLVVGAGTIGLSTAFHLTECGYKSITVLDCGEEVPSAWSAGNDVNKIIRADYEDEWYGSLALKAIRTWLAHPLFAPHYRHVGYLVTTTCNAPEKARSHVSRLISSITSQPQHPSNCLTLLPSATHLQKAAPQLTGLLPGWSGYANTHAGYAHAAPALKAVYTELVNRGVTFRLGNKGCAKSILPNLETAKMFPGAKPYVRTADGEINCADVVVLALGAHTARVLPCAGKQLTAKAWAVAHVKISQEEAKRLTGVPVVNCRDLGFFFEPVKVENQGREEWWIKLCAHGAGYTNRGDDESSLPPVDAEENAGIPRADEVLIRRLLEHALPEFANRPLMKRFMCWCADTADSDYVIDYVPGYEGLVLAGGDSGHAFKMLPVFGEWVADVVGKGKQEVKRWKWKEGESNGEEDLHWRVGNVKDIRDIERKGDECDQNIPAVRPRL